MIRSSAALKEHLDRGGAVALTAYFDAPGFTLVDPATGETVHRQALRLCLSRDWAVVTRTDLAGEPLTWGRP